MNYVHISILKNEFNSTKVRSRKSQESPEDEFVLLGSVAMAERNCAGTGEYTWDTDKILSPKIGPRWVTSF
jgi:hypothetical protein